jgi:hypothetical protein
MAYIVQTVRVTDDYRTQTARFERLKLVENIPSAAIPPKRAIRLHRRPSNEGYFVRL